MTRFLKRVSAALSEEEYDIVVKDGRRFVKSGPLLIPEALIEHKVRAKDNDGMVYEVKDIDHKFVYGSRLSREFAGSRKIKNNTKQFRQRIVERKKKIAKKYIASLEVDGKDRVDRMQDQQKGVTL